MGFKALVFFTFITSGFANAEQVLRKSLISVLHPTQSAVGELAVEDKKQSLKDLSDSKLEKYLDNNPVPVVIGPDRILYMTDHHHLALALQGLKYQSILIEIVADLSGYDEIQFWNKMIEKNWVYLIDENGVQITPQELPFNVNDMKDDIYRSLSYFVREKDGYKKTDIPFAEFAWAEFFRTRISKEDLEKKWDKTLKKAIDLSHCPEANKLPGFTHGICSNS
jgi:hypothetical protein